MDYDFKNVPRGTIEKFLEKILLWNSRINLVSFKNEQELIDRHILDSLQLIDYLNPEQIIFDIGSGAGFPGIILSYAGIKEINLVEKIAKKADFLRVAASISPNKVNIFDRGIETIRSDKCDVITARGFASLEKIFALTQNLAKTNTKYLLLKGKNVQEEIKNASINWDFEYIIHNSKTSEDGYILEIERLKKHEQKS
jgi:16S rRNA (guanine527-N7)-methyltransferase